MSRTQESAADHSRRLGQAATVFGVLSLLGFAWLLSITATSLAAGLAVAGTALLVILWPQ